MVQFKHLILHLSSQFLLEKLNVIFCSLTVGRLILTHLPFHADALDIPRVENILEHPDFFEVHKLFTLRDLFNANAHLGHFEGCWDPLMKPYLYGIREHHHIIDLNQTVVHLRVYTLLTIELMRCLLSGTINLFRWDIILFVNVWCGVGEEGWQCGLGIVIIKRFCT